MSGSVTIPPAPGYEGSQNPTNVGGGLMGGIDFMVRQILSGQAHAQLVMVQSVTGGGINKPAMVSVQPMVAQVDGRGNQVPHGTVYNIPCFRYQAGNTAVIVDPVVGDKGVAVFCDRDISKVKDTGQLAGPGSRRQNSFSDGLYMGGFLNGTPTTYIQASDSGGVSIVSPLNVTINAQNVQLDSTGNLKVKGEVTAKDGGGASVSLTTHRNTNVQTGGGNSGAPLPGS